MASDFYPHRPCPCDRPGCPLCKKIHQHEAGTHDHPIVRRWAGERHPAAPPAPPPAPPPARKSLPCAYAGENAGPKGWFICDHPDEPLGMVVCPCKGCGPRRCPGYSPAPG